MCKPHVITLAEALTSVATLPEQIYITWNDQFIGKSFACEGLQQI